MSGRTLRIETAEVFEPLLSPARYKGAYGGRGSGKSHFFASLMIEDSLAEPGNSGEGLRSVCIREVQKDLSQSAKLLLEDKLRQYGLTEADGFKAFRDVIETPGDGLIIFKGMQDYTADSIKSLERFKRAWWEEAQTASAVSLELLRPTLRDEGSELWFSWNPRRKADPVDQMLRGANLPTGANAVRANWSDNPWFPSVLEQERQDCLRDNASQYDHIWEGGYVSIVDGAYFARELTAARREGRIGRVAADPLLTIGLFIDIGGTGARADAFAMWAAQFVGKEIRVLDYYEAVGQPIGEHLNWMRSKGYVPARSQVWLPHDGATNDKVANVSYESAFRSAGYAVTVIPNQGRGAASQRIEAIRRLFPACWFNETTTEPGRDALGWYHEKKDDARGIGLGPEHDWSSHGCFHGKTGVLTRYGTCQIMDLPETGEILTPCGWKQYIYPRVTRRDAPLVEVAFTDGHSVRCTPDHLFLTESGWKSAEFLTPNTVIQSTLMKSRSISMGGFTDCGPATAICRVAAKSFTETFGHPLLVLFRRVVTSTIEMGTYLIINLRIWSASRRLSTCPSHGLNVSGLRTDGFPPQPAIRLRNGTHPLRGGFGTKGTQNVPKAGRSGSARSGLANTVANFIWRLFEKAAMQVSIARKAAKFLPTDCGESKMNGPLRIESVRAIRQTADVWDITVPDGHCFSLANGAVVHNSDAFGLMCVAHENRREKPKLNMRPVPSLASGSWMGR